MLQALSDPKAPRGRLEMGRRVLGELSSDDKVLAGVVAPLMEVINGNDPGGHRRTGRPGASADPDPDPRAVAFLDAGLMRPRLCSMLVRAGSATTTVAGANGGYGYGSVGAARAHPAARRARVERPRAGEKKRLWALAVVALLVVVIIVSATGCGSDYPGIRHHEQHHGRSDGTGRAAPRAACPPALSLGRARGSPGQRHLVHRHGRTTTTTGAAA